MKASVQQAAMVREHNWTPSGARMPLRLAMPPSTMKASSRFRPDLLRGSVLLTSVVKRGRHLMAPSPISEEEEGPWIGGAGPRRLSYSSKQAGCTPTLSLKASGKLMSSTHISWMGCKSCQDFHQ